MGEIYRLERKSEGFFERSIRSANKMVGASVGCLSGLVTGLVGAPTLTVGEQLIYHGLSPEIAQNAVYAGLHWSPFTALLGTGVGLVGAKYVNSFLFGKK